VLLRRRRGWDVVRDGMGWERDEGTYEDDMVLFMTVSLVSSISQSC
jgi:hypothetical protein